MRCYGNLFCIICGKLLQSETVQGMLVVGNDQSARYVSLETTNPTQQQTIYLISCP